MDKSIKSIWPRSFLFPGIVAGVLAASSHGRAQESVAKADDYLVVDRMVNKGASSNHVRVYAQPDSQGEHVIMIPSLGRGVEDFTEKYRCTITTRLVEAGFRVVLIQPRGAGKSTGDLTPEFASMSTFSRDIKLTLNALEIERAHLVGHAFGNRLARTFATLFPSSVNQLVLLASGGGFPLSDEQVSSLTRSMNLRLPEEDRLTAIKQAFFAEGNDPQVWLNGWYPRLAEAQAMAARMTEGDFFKEAGGKPFLLIQATEDFIAPPNQAGRPLKQELGAQVSYVEVTGAGHAMCPERPDEVANHMIKYFRQSKVR